MKKILYICFLSFFLNACYTDTVESFKTFTFQFPVNVHSIYLDRAVPDTSLDFSNLYKYDEYHDNKDKINKAMLLQFNYWIDSLMLPGNIPYDPEVDDLQFDFVRYKLMFARSKFGDLYSQDPNDFEPDPEIETFELGVFNNVNVRDFYRNPSHIIDVPENVSKRMSEYLISKPYFYIVTEYSRLNNQTEENYNIPYLEARFDAVIRFEVEL